MTNLPTRVELDREGWDDYEMVDDLQQAMNDYLSDTYGYLVYDFYYRFSDTQLIIDGIHWDTRED